MCCALSSKSGALCTLYRNREFATKYLFYFCVLQYYSRGTSPSPLHIHTGHRVLEEIDEKG
jgi:hypothetical protein